MHLNGVRRNVFFFFIYCCIFSLPAAAQFYQLNNYNVKDGLPSSEVYAMMQDRSGYLWFTTDMGVSRFNGYEFKNFSTENGLTDNTNFGLVQDMKGRIWFRSFSGMLSYYENEKMHSLPCNPQLEKISKDFLLTSLYTDSGDTIWAGMTKDVVLKIAPPWKAGNVTVLDMPAKGGYIFYPDGHGFVFGGTTPEFFDITFYGKNFRREAVIPVHKKRIGTDAVRFAVTQLSDQSYMATIDNELVHFTSTTLLASTSISAVAICVLEEKGKGLFVGSYDGVCHFSDVSFNNKTRVPNCDHKIITALCEDHENGIWFCTEGSGVYYQPFPNFSYYTSENGISESKISCAAKSGPRMLCGHLDGTISVLEGNSVKSLWLDVDSVLQTSSRRTSDILCTGDGIALVSTVTAVFEINTKEMSSKLAMHNGAKKMIFSRDSGLWSLRFRAIYKYDSPASSTGRQILLHFYSDNIYEDHTGKLWICPVNGIWTYDSIAGLVSHVQDDPLLNARIVDVKEADDGNIWMVSRGNGVIVQKGKKYFGIRQKDGLASNMCRSILIDSGNVVWIGTNNGISRITLLPGKDFRYSITTYTSENGLLTNEVNNIIRQGNKLWLMHNNGISIFDPAAIRNNNNPPPVYIVNTIVNGDTFSTQHSFSLRHNQNYFNISFIGLAYKNAGHIEYKYKMEGIDSSWIYTPYTSVQYQTIPPGTYRFLVYAKNNDGTWSKNPATLSFTILPAWWQTWQFKLLAGIFILALALWLFRLRIDAVRERDKKKAELQNRVAAIELKALRAQMNPHFVFNAINSVQYFITNNDPDSSQKHLSKFARLIRYVVDNSKLTSIPVNREIEALVLYLDLEALRFGEHFSYDIHIDKNVDPEYLQIPSMLIQPYVENAIWHGIMHKKGKGHIDIRIDMQENVLHCTIEDNGIGRQQSREIKLQHPDHHHESVGMSNTKERLEIINHVNNSNLSVEITDLYDEKGNARGTRVEIYIPSAFIS